MSFLRSATMARYGNRGVGGSGRECSQYLTIKRKGPNDPLTHHASRHRNARRRLKRSPPSHERQQSEISVSDHFCYLLLYRSTISYDMSVHQACALGFRVIRALIPLLLAGAAFGSVADDLRAFEGLRLQAYLDTTNHWTVGYGRRCDKGAVMTKEKAESALSDDITKAEQSARRAFPSYDSQPQHVQDVLTELCFQIGSTGMRKFVHFGQAIHDRDYALASACLIDSRFHKQCKQRCETIARKLTTHE